ncbi:sensor histidine kinase [Amycolatopsis sp. NPDC058340]|uniref:sensor histidine kinase n=1 Tax=Amycolatopsis sp. NPDC058340 TaxID=3346453 RepID=UPI0036465F23
MSESQSVTFVRAMLRKGSSVLSASPADEAPDPDSVPDWRYREDSADTLLMRAIRYSALGPIFYRVAAFPKVYIGFLVANGSAGIVPVLSTAILGMLLNVFAVWWVVRGRGIRAKTSGRLMYADLAVGVVLTTIVAAAAPAEIQPFAVDVAWTWMVGTVALWTLSFGLPAACLLVIAAVPFRAFLTWIGGLPLDHPLAMSRSVGCMVALVVAMVTTAGILILLGVGTRFALGIGMRRGQRAERLRTQRVMHDSVLQTLEAMGLEAPDDDSAAAERLAEMRATARAQAAELRRELTGPDAPSARGLAADLAEVATEMARDGLRTQLVAAETEEDYRLSHARRTAIRDAVREALRNTVKHAGTKQVVLRVEECEGGVAVIARDQGTGFSMLDRPPGFGISQSIMARLAEVGGRGTIDSHPGRGTRVTLWVPH